jgi:hypothetical protein
MAPITVTPVVLGDKVTLRKPHACRGNDWSIVRVGADIGLKCGQCGGRIQLSRREFQRRLVTLNGQKPAQS